MTEARKLRVGVLFGGRSSEHKVSLNSARNVMDALEKAGHKVVPIGISPEGHWLTGHDPLALLTGDAHSGLAGRDPNTKSAGSWALLPQERERTPLPVVDVIFPVLHGTYGEDGTVQGLLEMANLPYVGCGVLASATAMDKAITKQLFAQAGLPQVDYRVVMRSRLTNDDASIVDELEKGLGYPMFVKPANLGSSIGISKVHNREELSAALALAARYDRKVVVEAAIPNPREIEVSVLGNDDPAVSVPGEIVPANEFYDYEAKYVDDNSRLIVPAELDSATVSLVQDMALRAFRAVDGSGLARVDFLLDAANDRVAVNELNSMPGFTRTSMYPKLWEATGVTYPQLVDRLLDLALERFEDRQRNRTTLS